MLAPSPRVLASSAEDNQQSARNPFVLTDYKSMIHCFYMTNTLIVNFSPIAAGGPRRARAGRRSPGDREVVALGRSGVNNPNPREGFVMKETKKLRNLLVLGSTSVMLLLGVALMESREALAAAPTQNVVVTNTQTNPVPVDGTVEISGTPASITASA